MLIEKSLADRDDVKLGDADQFFEIMNNRKKNFERVSEENWESRKADYPFIPYFEQLKEDLDLEYRAVRLHKYYLMPTIEIDPAELLANLKKVWERKLIVWSSDPTDWLPIQVTMLLQWVRGSSFCSSEWDSLGVALIKTGRQNLLEVLGEAGDDQAKMRTKRSRKPPELVGRGLRWKKVTETTWVVRVIPKKTESKYDRIYQKWKHFYED